MTRRGFAAIALAFACAVTAAHAQDRPGAPEWDTGTPVPLIDEMLTHWVGERIDISNPKALVDDALPRLAEGTLRMTPRFGWTRTKDIHRSFRLEFEYRGSPGDGFSVYVRTWPTLDDVGAPANGSGFLFRAVKDDWHRVVIECRGDRAQVWSEGQSSGAAVVLTNPAGYVGLRGNRGQIEIRNVVLTPLLRSSRTLAGLRPSDDDAVAMPRLRQEVKPRYTADAMRQRIQGAVLLEIVVQEDGSVGEVAVLESLDPQYGLDDEALKAARQWRFDPAMKDGAPVALIVTLELQFTLK